MTREDLDSLGLEKDIVESTLLAMKDVRLFVSFDSTVKLGVTVDSNLIPFERLMVFRWIKELINER